MRLRFVSDPYDERVSTKYNQLLNYLEQLSLPYLDNENIVNSLVRTTAELDGPNGVDIDFVLQYLEDVKYNPVTLTVFIPSAYIATFKTVITVLVNKFLGIVIDSIDYYSRESDGGVLTTFLPQINKDGVIYPVYAHPRDWATLKSLDFGRLVDTQPLSEIESTNFVRSLISDPYFVRDGDLITVLGIEFLRIPSKSRTTVLDYHLFFNQLSRRYHEEWYSVPFPLRELAEQLAHNFQLPTQKLESNFLIGVRDDYNQDWIQSSLSRLDDGLEPLHTFVRDPPSPRDPFWRVRLLWAGIQTSKYLYPNRDTQSLTVIGESTLVVPLTNLSEVESFENRLNLFLDNSLNWIVRLNDENGDVALEGHAYSITT